MIQEDRREGKGDERESARVPERTKTPEEFNLARGEGVICEYIEQPS
jgi:hypothetical protein